MIILNGIVLIKQRFNLSIVLKITIYLYETKYFNFNTIDDSNIIGSIYTILSVLRS